MSGLYQRTSQSVGSLLDTDLTNLVNTDVLTYENELWKNKPVAGSNSKVFMRLDANFKIGNITEEIVDSWILPATISEPAGLYQSSTDIFRAPRNGHYSINFQTSMESTTTNSGYARIKLYQNGSLVCHSHESEGFAMYLKTRFLSLNIILYVTTTDILKITIQGDNGYNMPAFPYTNLSIHNVD